jgi:hypothetical protein
VALRGKASIAMVKKLWGGERVLQHTNTNTHTSGRTRHTGKTEKKRRKHSKERKKKE